MRSSPSYPAEVSVVASVHGLPDGPVRDAILREVGAAWEPVDSLVIRAGPAYAAGHDSA
jgi:hypothetical protein